MTDKRLHKNTATELIEFYDDLEKFIDKNDKLSYELKAVTLLRLGMETLSEKEGLEKACYIMSSILKTTLGISLGKDDDFSGILNDSLDKNTMH